MNPANLILAMFIATSLLYADDNKASYALEFSNAKVSYIDVPTLNLQLKPKQKDSFEFIIEYASSLFSNTKEQDIAKKQHSLFLAFNYEF